MRRKEVKLSEASKHNLTLLPDVYTQNAVI